IQLRTTAGSQSYTRSISLQGPVCGPAAFARMTRDQLKKVGDSVTCRLYQPSSGPFRSTRMLVGEESVDGRTVLRMMAKAGNAQQGPVWLMDREGFIFEREQEISGSKIVSRIADRETALRALD